MFRLQLSEGVNMVKRFKIKFIYETSNDTITEEDIKKNLDLKIDVFDTFKVISIDEV